MDPNNHANLDPLPPHSPETEKAALASIFDAARAGSQTEVDNFLQQLSPNYFYDLRHRSLYMEMNRMRQAGHAIDLVTTYTWLQHEKQLEAVGGFEYWNQLSVQEVMYIMFPAYALTLQKLAARRWALGEGTRISIKAREGDLDLKQLRAEIGSALDTLDKATHRDRPLIEIVTLAEAKAYVPEPKTFLVGADMISLGEVTVIAGLPGLGKSRLANTLAFAGARGKGEWMGYVVRRPYRTLILQSENSMRRIQSEVKDLPESYGEFVRFSKPTSLSFGVPDFRHAVRRIFENWPFDVVIIDPWSDVVRDEKFSDYQEGLENVMASLPPGDQRPAIVIVAHLKKGVLGDKRMTGRQLMGQVSGSMRLMQKARTAFMLQPASDDISDDRVIFDCGKSNNDTPLPMSAWYRRNGDFVTCPIFDFDEWLSPSEDKRAGSVTEDVMKGILNGRKITLKLLVNELKDKGYSQATAYRAAQCQDKYAALFTGKLVEEDGFLTWRES
jgi:hypothetical protein